MDPTPPVTEITLWQIGTLLVAVYAAALSTYNLYTSRKEQTPNIEVEISYGVTSQGPFATKSYLITVMNKGKITIILSSIRVILDKGLVVTLRQPMVEGRLPYELHSQDSFTVDYSMDELNNTLVENQLTYLKEIKAECIDKLGRKYVSKSIRIMK